MPQVSVVSSNISIFRFGVQFDIYQRKVTFDASLSTYLGSSGSGRLNLLGMSFALEDQEGVKLAEIDFTDAAKFIVPGTTQVFEVDLSSLSIPFLFQTYKITGAVKDADGTVTTTTPVYKKVCQPVGITESGYVPGTFQLSANCPDNVLTVKELTLLTYNNQDPVSTTKSGTLYYPTGTIASTSFTGTPFTNTPVYTGQYRIVCSTVSEYDLEDDVSVLVTYSSNYTFEVTCSNKIADLLCCIKEIQTTYELNCDNAKGKFAKQQLDSISIPFMVGLTKEINGQDASTEAELIKKTLKCDCGATSIRQNEFTPINPSVTDIVLTGAGGTSVPAATINGTAKTYAITSSIYQVVKLDSGDLAFSIDIDTATSNTVKYKIGFNYENLASYVLNAISGNASLVTQLNSLITATGANIDLTGLDGNCVLDISTNLLLVQAIKSATTKVLSLTTTTETFNAPANLFASTPASVQSWLNTLGLGTFTVSVNNDIFSVLSLSNSNPIVSLSFAAPDLTVPFQKNNLTLVGLFQSIIDYLCELTSLQVKLGSDLLLWQINYNGEAQASAYLSDGSQSAFNAGVSASIANIVFWIINLTGVTCAKIKALFTDNASGSFNQSTDRIYGTLEGSCRGISGKQMAELVIAAINANNDVKQAFCAIDCESPGTCPEITNISIAALSNTSIGLYGVTWDTNPISSQLVTVMYKLTDAAGWTTATNLLALLPNGTINGTTPFQITGLVAGQIYDVKVVNNCGGVGFSKQITTPSESVYSDSYLVSEFLYLACAGTPMTLYTAQPFAIGQIVYTNIGLTVPLTGYNYIVADGEIYTIDSATGEVLEDTGSNCTFGVDNQVILGNNTGTICDSSVTSGYTNGAFTVGGTLYSDSGLTTPVTGYSYVVNTANNQIYDLNSATGVIGAATGLNCGAYGASFRRDNVELDVCAASPETLYSATPFAPGVTMYTDSGLTTPATGQQFIAPDSTGEIYNMNSVTGVVGIATGGSCS